MSESEFTAAGAVNRELAAEFVQRVLDQLPATVWTVDRNLAITSCLGLGPRIHQREPNHNVGVTLFEHFQTDDPQHPPIAMHLRALRGESVRYEGTTAEQPTEVSLEPMRDETGAVIGCIAVSVDISERKRIERALAVTQRQYHDLVEHIADMMYSLDVEGRFTFVNARLAETLGYDRSAMIGEWAGNFIMPEDHAKTEAAFNRRLRGEIVEPYEFALKAADNTAIPIEINSTTIHDAHGAIIGTQAILRDLRPRMRDAALLRESERRLNQLAEQSDQVIWMSDSTLRRLLFVGKSYERIWGRPREELLDDPEVFLDAVHPQDRDRVRAHVETHRRGEASTAEYRIIRPDGSIRWICDKSFPIADHGGQVYRAAGIAEDITERREADELQRQQRTILEMIARGDSVDSVLHTICRATEDLVPGTLAMLTQRQGEFLRVIAAPSLSPTLIDDVDALALGRFLHEVARAAPDGPWRITRDHDHPWRNFAEVMAEHGVRCAWCYPIHADKGAILGVMCALSTSGHDEPSTGHAAALDAMTSLAGIALDRALADENRTLMLRELDHRVKNNLTTLVSLAQLTQRHATSTESFVESLLGRINSMSIAHELLASSKWQGANLRTLLTRVLEPYRAATHTIRLDGDDVLLPARVAQPVCFVLHELATNASKYGALSQERGVVTVAWFARKTADDRSELRLTWCEENGPELSGPPSPTGFGMHLIEGLMTRQLSGEVEILFPPTGLHCHLAFTLSPAEGDVNSPTPP